MMKEGGVQQNARGPARRHSPACAAAARRSRDTHHRHGVAQPARPP